jgi:hypothetical protein
MAMALMAYGMANSPPRQLTLTVVTTNKTNTAVTGTETLNASPVKMNIAPHASVTADIPYVSPVSYPTQVILKGTFTTTGGAHVKSVSCSTGVDLAKATTGSLEVFYNASGALACTSRPH